MPAQMYPVDTLQITRTPYSVNIAGAAPMASEPAVVLTMPLPVAKQLCLILRQQLKDYERQYGEIVLPPESYKGMGVAPEDWGKWLG